MAKKKLSPIANSRFARHGLGKKGEFSLGLSAKKLDDIVTNKMREMDFGTLDAASGNLPPANQRALARGLGSGGSIAAILAMVAELRKHTQIPIILFGYYNPYMHYGCERLCRDAAGAGGRGRFPTQYASTTRGSSGSARPVRLAIRGR